MQTLKNVLHFLAVGFTAVLILFDPWFCLAWLLAGAFGDHCD
jgi:hypothetical protein